MSRKSPAFVLVPLLAVLGAKPALAQSASAQSEAYDNLSGPQQIADDLSTINASFSKVNTVVNEHTDRWAAARIQANLLENARMETCRQLPPLKVGSYLNCPPPSADAATRLAADQGLAVELQSRANYSATNAWDNAVYSNALHRYRKLVDKAVQPSS